MTQYYDACIFQCGLNPELKDYDACRRVLDTSKITWCVIVCTELINLECSVEEFLAEFETDCQRNQVSLLNVVLVDAKSLGKLHRDLKKRLLQLGFGGNDWHHLCAARSAKAEAIVTIDQDFFDPANKKNPKSKKKGDRVKRIIESECQVQVIEPAKCPQ